MVADETYHIDRPDLARIVIERVEQRDDRLLVGGGDVETVQVGVLGNHFHQLPDVLYLKVDILSVYVLGQELLVEEVPRE